MPNKIPVVLQMSAADCGAACLTMIVRYWGGNITSKMCQVAMGTAADGSTALTIAQTARQFGLEVQAFRHTVQGVAQTELPAIIHWQGIHFVVLEAWGKDTVKIVDPAVGRRTLSHQEFAQKYSDVTLSFTPGADFSRIMADQAAGAMSPRWQTYIFLRQLWAVPQSKALFGWLLITSLALQLIGLALPLATWLVVEKILPPITSLSHPFENILALSGAGIAIAIFSQAAITYWRSTITIQLQQRLDSHLIPDFFNHLLSLPYTFFQRRTTGDLISRLAGNTIVREIITSGVLTSLLDGGLAIFYLLILYNQAPIFGLIVTSAAVGQFLLLLQANGQLHEHNQITLATRAEEDSFTVQMVSGIESIKGMGAESWMFAQWGQRFAETMRASAMRDHYVARINSLLQLLTFGTPLILLWVGTYLVQANRLSLGAMLALVVLASSSLAPLTSLTHHFHRAQQLWAYLERLSDVLESKPERQVPAIVGSYHLQGHIQVTNLSFRYRQNGAFDLHDLSCEIKPGTKVALVGRSGAGKSTLMRLLLGLYLLEQGEILYDGRPLTELNLTSLRQGVGVVLQDPFIFSGSIKQNIAWHQSTVSKEKIITAAKTADIHDEIQRLPMGYETWVGEGGSGLSGGQKQRIALARALVNQPSVLFLDEATSHLDTATEKRIYQVLDQLHITQLVIAHRLSSIHNADQILVMDKGRLAENGHPDELLAKDGLYRHLVREQAVQD